MVGGCVNGQVVIWDIGEYVPKLSSQISIYDHDIVMEKQTDKLHIQDGFIPVLYWSAESNMKFSHKLPIEDLQWLPANVWVSFDDIFWIIWNSIVSVISLNILNPMWHFFSV